ncbi:MAG: MlaD family protein [Paramuribaculum sp.]|nr:MlaD family protein [Paramuribaculum sp.]MDE6324340.1 MlaD family protein [Paramuribaculum sp.]MDE6488413.1 MlaD family protein [Paramuribaculum sp.]
MKRPPKTFVIGLSVLLALLVVIVGINFLKGVNMFKAANYYYASYTNVAGLNLSAPVTINGYKIGIVREIEYEYDNPGHIRVELSLDKALRLTKGTKAVLVADMLGTSTIQLVMGSEKDYLEVGSQLTAQQSGGLMDNVSNDLLPGITAMIPKIDSLLTALTEVVSNPAIGTSLDHLNATLVSLEGASRQLNGLMGSMPGIVSDAGATMTNVRSMSNNLNTISGDLTSVSASLKNMPLDATMQNVLEASRSLNEVLANLNNPNSSLGQLMNDRQLYDNLSNASASLDSLLIDVRKNPRRYISLKLF